MIVSCTCALECFTFFLQIITIVHFGGWVQLHHWWPGQWYRTAHQMQPISRTTIVQVICRSHLWYVYTKLMKHESVRFVLYYSNGAWYGYATVTHMPTHMPCNFRLFNRPNLIGIVPIWKPLSWILPILWLGHTCPMISLYLPKRLWISCAVGSAACTCNVCTCGQWNWTLNYYWVCWVTEISPWLCHQN